MTRRSRLVFSSEGLEDEVDIITSVAPGSISMTIRDWMGDTASLTLNQSQLKEYIAVLQKYVEE